MKIHNLPALMLCLCLVMTACSRQNIPSATDSPMDENPASSATFVQMDNEIFKVGDLSVTFGEFLFHYNTYIQEFIYSGQAEAAGIDPDIAPGLQQFENSEMTWEDEIKEKTRDNLQRTLAMYQEAVSVGYEMGDQEKASVQQFLDGITQLSVEEGVSEDTVVSQIYGEGITMEMAAEYEKRYWLGLSYEYDYFDNTTYTDAELTALYEEIEATVNLPDCTAVTIRNIFIANTQTARDVFEKFEQGDKTEDSFAKLAETYSEDSSTNASGGLYADLTPVTESDDFDDFDNWLYDSERQPGDYTLIRSDSGSELLYFVSKGDPLWKILSINLLHEEFASQIMDKYPITYPN